MVVVGSANVDVVLDVTTLPAPGETVLAQGRSLGPGGKGANQAVAAARAGAGTALVAALGDDDGGRRLRDSLTSAGVAVSTVRTTDAPTGTAYVLVESSGENAIVVDPGANAELVELTEQELSLIRSASVVLAQLEVPLATVSRALAAAGGLTVLNAAPAQALPTELTEHVHVLVVNQHEALLTAGTDAVETAVQVLLERVPQVLVTRGAGGVLIAERGAATVHVPVVPARRVVDTTGAGDVFCGAYAAARASGLEGPDAVHLAAAAASLSVERPGAARSAPTLEQARARLADG